MIAIFDLDGCISDDRWRRWALPEKESRTDSDYNDYHDLAIEDAPANKETVQLHIASGDDIIFLTSRPERYYDRTAQWLNTHWHFGPRCFRLIMRPNGDPRPSPTLKRELLRNLTYSDFEGVCQWVVQADSIIFYDNEQRVLDRIEELGVPGKLLTLPSYPRRNDVSKILREMANTFDERAKIYGENWRLVAPVIQALFPDGVPARLPASDAWHLFELVIVKLTRFAVSRFEHVDSIHDAGVYCAMVEHVITEAQG